MHDHTIRIVLVEDESAIADMYALKFRKVGFEIHVAGDGEEGVKLVQAIHPDIVLLDILLPKMDGYSVLEVLKHNGATKDIPVVLLTNLGQQEDIERGLAAGAVDYMVKANHVPAEIVEKVKQIIHC